jgi:hypothetical protein
MGRQIVRIVLRSALASAVLAVAVVASPPWSGPAAATSPGVGFTADALPVYQVNGIAWAVAVANGVVFVGGTFSSVRPPGADVGTDESPAGNFVALDAGTGRPTSCAPSFTGSPSSVRALAVSPDGRTLYAAGLFSAVDGVGVQNVAAIDLATCTPVKGFRPRVSGWGRGLTVARTGAVYLAGEFRTVNGQPRQHFAAFTPTGTLLPWAPDADLDGYTVAVTPDGRYAAIGGAFDVVDGVQSHALAVVSATSGRLVHGYPELVPAGSTVKSLDVDPTGIYTGNEGTGHRVFDGRIALDLGSFTERWRDTCFGATQAVLVDGSNLYGASHAHDCTAMRGFPNGRRQHLTVEGTHDPHMRVWWPDTNDGLGEGVGPRALAIASTGTHRYLFAAGEFTTVNGLAQQGILRLADGPDTGAPPAPSLSAGTSVARRVQLRWLASTDRDDERLTYRVYRDGGIRPVATLTADSDWWRRPQLSYVDTRVVPGTLYVYRVKASDGTGNTSPGFTLGVRPTSTSSRYAGAVLADKPTLFWRYDEPGRELGDESAAGNGALVLGTRSPRLRPAALARDSSTALGFDGETGFAYQARPEPAPSAFTVETWFRSRTTSGGKIVGFGDNATRLSRNYDRQVYLRNDGRLTFGVYTGVVRTLVSRAAYNDGRWHQVVASQGPRGMALYVDGRRVASNAVTSNRRYIGYWRVGGDNLSRWPVRPTSSFFAGAVDETAVYPRQLGADRVAVHYRASGR